MRIFPGCANYKTSSFPCQVPFSEKIAPGHVTYIRATNQNPTPVFLKDAKTSTFLDWSRQVGIENNKLAPANFKGMRGLMAKSPIKEDELLLSVPRTVAIAIGPKQRCPIPDFVKDSFWSSSPWFLKLAIILIYNKRQGPNSNLYQYIQQLPETFDTPALWPHSKLQLLQYPHLIHQVKEQQIEYEDLFQKFQGAVTPAATGPYNSAPISKEEFLWAISCVRSRTFSGPYVASTLKDRLRLAGFIATLCVANVGLLGGDLQKSLGAAIAALLFNTLYEVILSRSLKQYAICPLIDFINHSGSIKSEVSYDYFTDRYSVVAGADYGQNEEVYVSYGQHSNDILMQYYGFFEPSNPRDVYVMTNLLKWLDASCTAVDQGRLDVLNKEGFLKDLQVVSISRGGFPPETLTALRYLLASTGSPGLLMGPRAFTSSADISVEESVASVLQHALQSELNALGSSLAEDRVALSRKGDANGRNGAMCREEKLALAFRMEKKGLLLDVLKALGGSEGEVHSTRVGASTQPAV